VGTIAWRATSGAALERRVAAVEATGRGLGWEDGLAGLGRSYGFTDPDGHRMAIYYDSEHFVPAGARTPALKNQPQRMSVQGAAVRRLDHVNVWCRDIDLNADYMVDSLGFRVSEQAVDAEGRRTGAWLHVTPKSYDLAYGRVDPAGVGARLHHVAFAVDAREYVLRAADVFLDAGVRIEAGPAKHAVQQTFFLYAFEPGGNRVEIISDGRLLLAPDWRPITWTPEERQRGQAWGTQMPESWFTYATPPVETAGHGEMEER
jgi:catechol 2,3-dioxygenase